MLSSCDTGYATPHQHQSVTIDNLSKVHYTVASQSSVFSADYQQQKRLIDGFIMNLKSVESVDRFIEISITKRRSKTHN